MTALGAVPLVGAVLTGLPAAAGPVAWGLQVQSVELNKASVAVAGLNTVPVTIVVKATYDEGKPGQVMHAELNADDTYPGTQVFSEPLTLIAGSGTDGTWRGTVNVPSTANGKFVVSKVRAGAWDPKVQSPDMGFVENVSMTVKGVHIPKITHQVDQDPVPFGKPYKITWRVTDSATGKPYGTKLKVMSFKGVTCLETKGLKSPVHTNTAGALVVSYQPKDADSLNCLLLPGTQAPIDSRVIAPNRPGVVSATPAKTSAKVGTSVDVKGNVLGLNMDCSVYLQKLHGASQWRSLRSTKLGQSGRYTLQAQPTAKGKGTYRVQFPKCRETLAGVSKSFSITGV
ncbi:hypothetical protein GCM10009534_05400 [Kribbella sandramycini]